MIQHIEKALLEKHHLILRLADFLLSLITQKKSALAWNYACYETGTYCWPCNGPGPCLQTCAFYCKFNHPPSGSYGTEYCCHWQQSCGPC